MKIEVGKTYLTKDGYKVKILDNIGGPWPFYGIVPDSNQTDYWNEFGRFAENEASGFDLVELAPQSREEICLLACEGFESEILEGAEPGFLFRLVSAKEAKIQELESRVSELEKLIQKRSKTR